jgi:hypothetical protein
MRAFWLALLLLPSLALAKDFYVAQKDGNDLNPGTLEQPWLTVKKAAGTIKAGDTAYIRKGTYTEYFAIENSGKEGEWITLKNYPGDAPVIDVTDFATDWVGAVNVQGKSYVEINGLIIENCKVGFSLGVQGPGSNIRILNCEIRNHNTPRNAVYISSLYNGDPLSDVLVDGCKIHDVQTGNMEALRINKGVSRFIVRNCEVWNTTNIGIDVVSWAEAPFTVPQYGLIENNYCHDYQGDIYSWAAGIYSDGASYLTIQNNEVTRYPQGISIGAEHEKDTSTACIVRYNNIHHNHLRAIGLGGGGDGTHGWTKWPAVYNNDIVSNTLAGSASFSLQARYIDSGAYLKNNYIFSEPGRVIFQTDSVSWNPAKGVIISDYNFISPNNAAFDTYSDGWKSSLSAFKITVAPNEKNSFSSGSTVDAGGPLAVAIDAEHGEVLRVDNAHWFTDGYDLFHGDNIVVGKEKAQIVDIDYDGNILFLKESISWEAGDAVNLPFTGSAPDIGAKEGQEETPVPTATPTVTVTPTPTATATEIPKPTKTPTKTPSQVKITFETMPTEAEITTAKGVHADADIMILVIKSVNESRIKETIAEDKTGEWSEWTIEAPESKTACTVRFKKGEKEIAIINAEYMLGIK